MRQQITNPAEQSSRTISIEKLITRPLHVPIILIVSILLMLIGGFIYYYVQTGRDHQTIAALKQEVSVINSLQTDNAAYRSAIVSLKSENDSYQYQISSLQNDKTADKSQILSLEMQLQQLGTQFDQSKQELSLYKTTYGSEVNARVEPPFQDTHLVSNSRVADPTWEQLRSFLLEDKTDRNPYVPGVYTCGEFARDLYNHAEQAGIKAGWVAIKFKNNSVWHAINAFMTTDKGLVFIDDTGLAVNQTLPVDRDKIVNVKKGQEYIPNSVFPDPNCSVTWQDMGTVEDVQLFW